MLFLFLENFGYVWFVPKNFLTNHWLAKISVKNFLALGWPKFLARFVKGLLGELARFHRQPKFWQASKQTNTKSSQAAKILAGQIQSQTKHTLELSFLLLRYFILSSESILACADCCHNSVQLMFQFPAVTSVMLLQLVSINLTYVPN